ncbi:hypothetical protein [Mycoplasmopsis pulmonis]|uniref:hypothetical protein n=1 Tax=Mycoplasmopsis pulmonis TaxID=2107 RepID=UPI002ACEEA31|nr:hypothetical protein [Mycoplasmopsis pulmonis]MDZ7293417.1 hypothetical protein [Mycoplasmopsis pulmonis]
MHDKKLLDSDFAHLHKFLNLKVRKNFLLVPFFSNILFWMLFSSLLEVKLFDRELVKKMKKSYFRRLILPLLIFVVFIIPWWVWTILTHSHTGFATFAYSKFSLLIWALSPLVIFFILNPIFIHTRNSYIKKVYENMKTNGQLIEDPIEVVSINSWDAYLHSYLWGIKKNRWRSRASDNFEVKIAEEKIPYYNIAPSKKLGWNYKK